MKLTNKSANIAAAIMLGIMFCLTFATMLGDSLTMDEKSHLPAGYSYVTQADMRINPEHPPLVKDLAGIPLLFIPNLNFPYNSQWWNDSKNVNAQWDFGYEFLFKSGNPADLMIFWGRIPMILLLMVLGFYIFKWTRQLAGNLAALLALFLFSFSPTFIAHGHLVTTDVAAALAITFGTYYFIRALKSPTKKNIIISGIALGIAELLKFSAILLFPFFILLAGLWWLIKEIKFWNAFKMLFWIFLICFLVIGPVYLFHTWNYPPQRQTSDTKTILASHGLKPAVAIVVWASDKPVLRAYAQYFLGVLMVGQRVTGGNTTYFMGEINRTGWRTYFPIMYLIKETITLHILTLIALFYAVVKLKKPSLAKFSQIAEFIKKYFPQTAMLVFIAVYWFTSIAGNLNIGIRHLLPIFPFMMILTAIGVNAFIDRDKIKIGIIAVLCFFQIISVALAYPHYLSYYSEAVGGAKNGYLWAVDSSLDWGQDLKRLKTWTQKNNISKIYIDYFGGADVGYYFGNSYEGWWGDRNPNDLAKGSYLAVSATLLQGSRGKAVAGQNINTGYYKWLDKYQPVTIIGNSIFVYHIQ